MNVTPKIAVVAGCLAAVVLATGCGAQPGSTHRASIQGCAAYGVLVGWLMRGRIGLPRGRQTGTPPAVIAGHFGLAVTGLAGWAAYLATDRVFLAWTAVGLLLVVAGLGMATLFAGLDGPAHAAVTWAGASADGLGVGPAEEVSAGILPSGGRPPVLLIAGHGALAMATLLLAVAAAAGR